SVPATRRRRRAYGGGRGAAPGARVARASEPSSPASVNGGTARGSEPPLPGLPSSRSDSGHAPASRPPRAPSTPHRRPRDRPRRGERGEGTGGGTEPLRPRIVLPFGGPLPDTDHVTGHELVHAFQFDITTNPNAPPGQNGAERLPLWFIEGMAEYLSLGPVDPN